MAPFSIEGYAWLWLDADRPPPHVQIVDGRSAAWPQNGEIGSMTLAEIAANAMVEVRDSTKCWRIVHLLGSSELRRRFSRSRLGQMWLTISTAMFTLALGLFWSQVLKVPTEKMIPFLAIGQIIWVFIAGMIAEASMGFQGHAGYLQNQYLPNGAIILAIVYRHILVFCYNSVIIVAIMLYYGLPWTGLGTFFFFFAATSAILVCVCYVIAMLCVRFRDMIQVVGSVMNLMYFFTPILWKPQLLDGPLSGLLYFNPFATLLTVLRKPLMGEALDTIDITIFAAIMIVSVTAAAFLVGRLRHRIIFWI